MSKGCHVTLPVGPWSVTARGFLESIGCGNSVPCSMRAEIYFLLVRWAYCASTHSVWVGVVAANGPQYTVVGQSPNVQQATTDPRFGVPPRISPTHQAPASYTQEAYNASGTQAPSATQYPSQAAPVAAQPAQYGAPQVQYPSQPSSMQPSQYPGSNTAQAVIIWPCFHSGVG